jgi:Arc/MetJ family transcription regulator
MQEQININYINAQLLENALKITGFENKEDVINLALEKLLQMAKQRQILELEGKINWEGNLEEMRTERDFN